MPAGLGEALGKMGREVGEEGSVGEADSLIWRFIYCEEDTEEDGEEEELERSSNDPAETIRRCDSGS